MARKKSKTGRSPTSIQPAVETTSPTHKSTKSGDTSSRPVTPVTVEDKVVDKVAELKEQADVKHKESPTSDSHQSKSLPVTSRPDHGNAADSHEPLMQSKDSQSIEPSESSQVPLSCTDAHDSLSQQLQSVIQVFLEQKPTQAYALSCQLLDHLSHSLSTKSISLSSLHKLILLTHLRVCAEVIKAAKNSTLNPLEEWAKIEDYFQHSGIPSDILIVGLLLLVKQSPPKKAKDVIESWIASQPDDYFNLVSKQSCTGQQGPEMIQYERIVEIYVLHVLAKQGDYAFAKEFLEFNDTISEEKKKTIKKALDDKLNSISKRTIVRAVESKTLPSKDEPVVQNNEVPPVSKKVDDIKPSIPESQNVKKPIQAATKVNHADAVPLSELSVKDKSKVKHWKDVFLTFPFNMTPHVIFVVICLIVSRYTLFKNKSLKQWSVWFWAKCVHMVKMGTDVQSL